MIQITGEIQMIPERWTIIKNVSIPPSNTQGTVLVFWDGALKMEIILEEGSARKMAAFIEERGSLIVPPVPPIPPIDGIQR